MKLKKIAMVVGCVNLGFAGLNFVMNTGLNTGIGIISLVLGIFLIYAGATFDD